MTSNSSKHLGQVLNCIVWLAYGLVLSDTFIILPNSLGLFLGFAQVPRYSFVFCCIYSQRQKSEINFLLRIVQLTETPADCPHHQDPAANCHSRTNRRLRQACRALRSSLALIDVEWRRGRRKQLQRRRQLRRRRRRRRLRWRRLCWLWRG